VLYVGVALWVTYKVLNIHSGCATWHLVGYLVPGTYRYISTLRALLGTWYLLPGVTGARGVPGTRYHCDFHYAVQVAELLVPGTRVPLELR